MADETVVTISKDSFLEPLGLGEYAKEIDTPQKRDAIFALVGAFCESESLILDSTTPTEGTELAWKVPGTALTVRIAKASTTELATFIALALFAVGVGAPPEALGFLPLVGLRERFRLLRVEFGERSIVEALKDVDAGTARNIVIELYGKHCRHPDGGCRYMDPKTQTCRIDEDETSAILEWLVGQGVLKKENPTPPIEYAVLI